MEQQCNLRVFIQLTRFARPQGRGEYEHVRLNALERHRPSRRLRVEVGGDERHGSRARKPGVPRIPDPAVELQEGIIRFRHAGKLLARVRLGGGERSLLEQWATDVEGRAGAPRKLQYPDLPDVRNKLQQIAIASRQGPARARVGLR